MRCRLKVAIAVPFIPNLTFLPTGFPNALNGPTGPQTPGIGASPHILLLLAPGDMTGSRRVGQGALAGAGLRGHGKTFLSLLHYSEEQEQDQGFEAEEGLMPAEDFMPVDELMPEEELEVTEEVVTAEEGVTEEAELVSEKAEAWEEVEAELDKATWKNVVTSALEASGLGPSYLDRKYVLQQLANWQDAHFRQQLRQKMLQKGECSHGGLPDKLQIVMQMKGAHLPQPALTQCADLHELCISFA